MLDIETTGLEPKQDLILEIGVVPFDEQLGALGTFTVLVASTDAVAWARATLAARGAGEALTIAQQMHLDNGLIEDLIYPNRFIVAPDGSDYPGRVVSTDAADAGHVVAEALARFGVPESIPLAGSSVRSLDAPMLAEHAPELFERFNHRTIDASSYSELVRFIDREGYEAMSATLATSGHRVIGDCLRSLDIVRRFRDRYGIGPHAAPATDAA
ncbi:Oligoribonuclease (plasmid) [Tsukamurella tyrosinosolvens]|nr:hypothetical protein [Tsukamurella tyrosinosolvens]KXO92979.1 hypothetical protein AXK58_14005 [Tsukamurella tyrosinosolvens]VEH94097.1 Oligoribonuclease [Tsukamurella tyrosinosolvens]